MMPESVSSRFARPAFLIGLYRRRIVLGSEGGRTLDVCQEKARIEASGGEVRSQTYPAPCLQAKSRFLNRELL